MITKIGIWEISDYGLIGKVNPSYDYRIVKERLWETESYRGHTVWCWLIHLTEKTWITKESIHELNTAFFFCQDYFKDSKPASAEEASTAQTLYIQQQIMDINSKMDSEKSEDSEMGLIIPSPEASKSLLRYIELHRDMKFLDI